MSQKKLFESEELDWRKEWQGMPEFIQEKKEKEFSKITVRFATEEDLKDFSKLIGQKLTEKTKSIWHPKIERGLNAHKLYEYDENA